MKFKSKDDMLYHFLCFLGHPKILDEKAKKANRANRAIEHLASGEHFLWIGYSTDGVWPVIQASYPFQSFISPAGSFFRRRIQEYSPQEWGYILWDVANLELLYHLTPEHAKAYNQHILVLGKLIEMRLDGALQDEWQKVTERMLEMVDVKGLER